MTGPSHVLDYPYPQQPFPSSVELLLGLSDFISPSFYLRKGIELVLDVDPVEWLSQEFAGDWEKVSQASTALTQLGEYFNALGTDVQDAAVDMSHSWDGHAAQNATAYFDTLASSIAGLQAPVKEIADALESTAAGIKSAGEAITDLMGLFLDYLIELGIAACATGALAWTGIGAAVGGAGTAYLAYKATSTWMKVVEAHGHATTAAKAVVGLTAGPLSLLNIDGDLDLPTSPYNHPLAG